MLSLLINLTTCCSEEDRDGLMVTIISAWCSSCNMGSNDRLEAAAPASSQGGAMPAPDGRSVTQCGGDRAAAWKSIWTASTKIHHIGSVPQDSAQRSWSRVKVVLSRWGRRHPQHHLLQIKSAGFPQSLSQLTIEQLYVYAGIMVGRTLFTRTLTPPFVRREIFYFHGSAEEFLFKSSDMAVSQNPDEQTHWSIQTSAIILPFCLPLSLTELPF